MMVKCDMNEKFWGMTVQLVIFSTINNNKSTLSQLSAMTPGSKVPRTMCNVGQSQRL